MKLYTVHLPPETPAAKAADKALFIRDGFSWFALVLPFVYVLWHRMWWVLLGVVAAAGAIEVAARAAGPAAGTILSIVFALAFATEANGLRRWTLARKGWRYAGTTVGGSLEEAERRFFETGVPAAATGRPLPAPAQAAPRPGLAARDSIIGLGPGFAGSARPAR
ncbi:DUF2628 domain-containing protein [Methylobrevis albus]|uniref:DUF2628 domain-containing protein n=1 Tax=Methylobrevis albus TaxID=2793297 RepID=A0A931I3V5_9HYPH|nr:DUF2628 domain-containing protein [Methylobrevis albus]MBH0238771.1 DUF2628 domain-containing protein [Methylobrevis albus]